MTDVAERCTLVWERIRAAARRAGRDPREIRLVGASKGQPLERLRDAVAAGVTTFGENFVQEAAGKIAALAAEPGLPHAPVTWHFIGTLQRNKVPRALRLFDVIESVDRLRLAEQIERVAERQGRQVRVLIEVNVGEEVTKRGPRLAAAADLVRACAKLPHLVLDGLMTVPPPATDPEASRPVFRALRALRDALRGEVPTLTDLSMGMTQDYDVAVEEGATLVRIGTALFGPRLTAR